MSSGDATSDKPLLRSFGRRRGRKLSPRQDTLLKDVLPRLSLDIAAPLPGDPLQLFDADVSEIWLEIGFGGAEHLLWQAQAHPHVGLIGAEPFEDGVVKALQGIETNGLKNVRLHADDVRPLLSWLAPATLTRAFVLFSDPWPKKRHAKRRLVSRALMAELARVIKPGGELRLGTDIASYAGEMLRAVRRDGNFSWTAGHPSDWRVRPADWPETRYEAKARREGRTPTFLRLQRVDIIP